MQAHARRDCLRFSMRRGRPISAQKNPMKNIFITDLVWLFEQKIRQ
jgi:hypothetical protein